MTAFHTAPEQLSSSTYDFGPPIFISVFDGLMCCGNPIRSLRFDTVPPTILYLNSFFWLVNLMLQKFHTLHSVLLPISDHVSVSADWLIFFCGNLILDQKKKKKMRGIARIKTPSLNQILWPEISYLLPLFMRGKLAASKIDCGDKI